MATISRQKTARFLIHLIFIMIIFVLPELVMNISMPNRRGASFFHIFYIKSAIFIAIFYVNFYFVIGRTIGRGTVNGIWRFIGWNILLIGVALFISTVLFRMNAPVRHRTVSPEHIHSARHALKSFSFILRDAVMMILTIALAVAIRLSDRWKMLEEHRRELHHEQKARELENLKSQLNPHFLFNTLNTLRLVAQMNQDKIVSEGIRSLSELLKNTLINDHEFITIQEEIDNLKHYFSIQTIRYAGSFHVNYEVDPELSDYLLPKLILQPLVENCFHHGFQQTEQEILPPWRIRIKTFQDEYYWYLSVVNNGLPFKEDRLKELLARLEQFRFPEYEERTEDTLRAQPGFGLENTILRLSIYYHGEQYFQAGTADNGDTAVIVGDPLHPKKPFVAVVDTAAQAPYPREE